ncbi:palmdelphin-like [Eucyclogobius newberryi]|uniref:palmdelphin-like n=1 Tax=Eucyclogobius newberryi TaxID=166745 RepID=UPI003B5B0094
MEEAELMKERLQFITEKHRVQELIRHKKQELDQEKLKLKHLKKKSLREQWLSDSSHNAPGSSSEQQTRSLLLSIYRVEKEIEALEREEAIVSKNESFILERLRAVEKSTQDIIKEAHDAFVPGKTTLGMVQQRNP